MAGAARKIEMDKKIIQAGRYDNKSTAEERDAFLRALLEADDEAIAEEQDEEAADEAEMLNEAIARTEEERVLFRQMDQDRRQAEENAWAAAGNPGKLCVLSSFLRSYTFLSISFFDRSCLPFSPTLTLLLPHPLRLPSPLHLAVPSVSSKNGSSQKRTASSTPRRRRAVSLARRTPPMG